MTDFVKFYDKIWDFYDKIYDTFSQNCKYFGNEQSVVVKNHWGIREFTHLRVGS